MVVILIDTLPFRLRNVWRRDFLLNDDLKQSHMMSQSKSTAHLCCEMKILENRR